MRFTSVLAAGAFAVFASAQATTTSGSEASPTWSLTPAQSSITACLDACKPGDVDCQSHCITVPSPDGAQANATTECVAACDQGDGSAADTAKYAACRDNCIKQHYYVTSEGTPQATGAAGGSGGSSSGSPAQTSAKPTNSASDSNDSDGDKSSKTASGSSTGTGTASSSEKTDKPNSASNIMGSSVLILGLFAGLMAL